MSSNELVLFEGEDRSYGSGLYVDLVPASSWGQNLRAILSAKEWTAISQAVSARCAKVCEGCDRASARIECHERWSYEEQTNVQRLRRFVGLCPHCHRATHFGFAQAIGRAGQAMSHLMKVNDWTKERVHQHLEEAFSLWRARSQQPWIVDFPISLSRKLREKAERLPNPLSPCVRICRLENGICIGCSRTKEQIAAWGGLPESTQRALTLRILSENG